MKESKSYNIMSQIPRVSHDDYYRIERQNNQHRLKKNSR